ncbi:hypothetical protein K439DRAFT_542207 [Ramaria rubella]|nr:hypothetical protein K439DRAFT_542207 [Ramaria rubella]
MSSSEDGYDSATPSPPSHVQHVSQTSVNQFVTNATGGTETPIEQPVAGPSRLRAGGAYRAEKRHRRQSTPSQPHDVREHKRARKDPRDRQPTMNRHDHIIDVVDRDVSSSPEPPARVLRSPPPPRTRRVSISMPGSLFSRSPTPDDHVGARRVRFASDIVSPVPRSQRATIRHTLDAGPPLGDDVYEEVEDENEDGHQESN